MRHDDPSIEPTGTNAGKTLAAGGRRRRVATYLIVAVVSLALGAGSVLLLHRFFPGEGTPAPMPAAKPAGQTAGEESMQDMPGMEGAQERTPPEGAAAGKAVYIPPERQQLIGVRTATIGHHEMDATIRTVGTLAYDETRVTQIHIKFAGWAEQVYVDYVGMQVRRGAPLFTVYSPELVSTQNEYLLALKARSQLGDSQVAASRAAADSLLAASLDRLKLWDIPEEHIKELERTGEVQRTMMLHSPFDGIVLERNVFPGQYVTPEMTTFRIADLSNIWVFGAVFEYELPLIKLGQEADIEFPYGQAKRMLRGKITFIYPEVDPQTRRVRIRIELPNPGLKFKPETYVTVVINTGGGHILAIPKEAVIDTGMKRYAIVALPNGYFEPRDIEVGEPGDEFYPLLGGLQEGDRVVTSAQFLIDSETNLQAAMKSMIGMPGMEMKGGGGGKGMEKPGQQPPEAAQPQPTAGHEKH